MSSLVVDTCCLRRFIHHPIVIEYSLLATMVSSKFIFTAGLLLLSSFSSAAPGLKNMDTNSGPVNKVEVGPSGEILVYHAVQKRQTYRYGHWDYKPLLNAKINIQRGYWISSRRTIKRSFVNCISIASLL